MPLSLLESPGAWDVDASTRVHRWAVDLAVASRPAAARVPLLLARFSVNVRGSFDDDLMTMLDGDRDIGGIVAELTIALAVHAVDLPTVTMAALTRPCRPGYLWRGAYAMAV